MKSVHIRDLPEKVLEQLKLRAKNNHRSLQGELHHVLAEAAGRYLPEADKDLDLKTVHTGGKKNWSRDDIYED